MEGQRGGPRLTRERADAYSDAVRDAMLEQAELEVFEERTLKEPRQVPGEPDLPFLVDEAALKEREE